MAIAASCGVFSVLIIAGSASATKVLGSAFASLPVFLAAALSLQCLVWRGCVAAFPPRRQQRQQPSHPAAAARWPSRGAEAYARAAGAFTIFGLALGQWTARGLGVLADSVLSSSGRMLSSLGIAFWRSLWGRVVRAARNKAAHEPDRDGHAAPPASHAVLLVLRR